MIGMLRPRIEHMTLYRLSYRDDFLQEIVSEVEQCIMSNLSQGLDCLVFKRRRKKSYKIKREGFVVVRSVQHCHH